MFKMPKTDKQRRHGLG